MSAILSADDLNDFISPGVACIKPVESLPRPKPVDLSNPYEVTTEDKLVTETPLPAAQISLTDCLACSGCVTSAEAVLVSLQSHAEVLNALDSYRSVGRDQLVPGKAAVRDRFKGSDERIFVASVSPQTRASIAATYGVTEREAGLMIEQLLGGSGGIRTGGRHGSGFAWVLDTNVSREVCLVLGAEEALESLSSSGQTEPKRPILTSSCPGWICYAEKAHPHILPHLSRLKSPQALLGTLIKTSLSTRLGIPHDKIWHVAIMPCFDKKLEASREELTDAHLKELHEEKKGIRDVDCVITTKELLMLADSRGIRFADLPRLPLSTSDQVPFPDSSLNNFFFASHISVQTPQVRGQRQKPIPEAGTSGGYLHHVLSTFTANNPGSSIHVCLGRNADVAEYTAVDDASGTVLLRTARYYGFRNIQNLVRKLKPTKKSRLPGARTGGTNRRPGATTGATAGVDYAYVEVMACPGGCTNGGGQIKVDDMIAIRGVEEEGSTVKSGPQAQKEWLTQVDEAYFSGGESVGEEEPRTASESEMVAGTGEEVVNGIDIQYIKSIVRHWTESTGISLEKLAYTTYRNVESDVGKGDTAERVVELAGKIGGGW